MSFRKDDCNLQTWIAMQGKKIISVLSFAKDNCKRNYLGNYRSAVDELRVRMNHEIWIIWKFFQTLSNDVVGVGATDDAVRIPISASRASYHFNQLTPPLSV